MAGCYGNSKEDRYFEKMLYDYLDEEEENKYDEYGGSQEDLDADLTWKEKEDEDIFNQ